MNYKNSEGYPDPTPYEAEKHIKAQLRGKRSKVAGQHFEQWISSSCKWYRDRGTAFIEKTPEPMKPLRKANRQGQFLACYTKAGQPDYKGTVKGGRAVVFEAKHTDGEKIDRKRLTSEQMNSLQTHTKLGAYCFVLVSLGLQDFYRVPWKIWRDMKKYYGHQYMNRDELKQFKVDQKAGVIKFLDNYAYVEPWSLDEICVICGAYVPEGSQVCPACKAKYSPKEGNK